MKSIVCVCLLCLFGVLAFADDQKEAQRVEESGTVMKEVTGMKDGIPTKLLSGAKCVIVLPSVKKVAVGIGGSYGRGVMTCRTGENHDGPWSPPVMMASEGGNFGFQLGGQATDFVILVMNDRGAQALLHNKVKLGADASIAAGPVGRDSEASTNATMQAQMLSYSRSRGVFGGVSLSGSSLRPDGSANEHLYGKKVEAEQIVKSDGVTMPDSAKSLVATLNDVSTTTSAKQ